MRRANTLRRFYVNVFRAHVLSVLASPSTNAEKRQTPTVGTKDAAGFQLPPATSTLRTKKGLINLRKTLKIINKRIEISTKREV